MQNATQTSGQEASNEAEKEHERGLTEVAEHQFYSDTSERYTEESETMKGEEYRREVRGSLTAELIEEYCETPEGKEETRKAISAEAEKEYRERWEQLERR